MKKQNKIVTFYSYKGGVGRSQLCANVAAYLCFHKDKNILLWDWDFEAPGLHYYFDFDDENIKTQGTLESLEDFVRLLRSDNDDNVSYDDLPYLSEKYITNLKKNSNGKKIDLIPAGNYNDNFSRRANNFDWYEFYNILDGVNYIEELKHKLKNDFDYDYILIDSRTGISDYSGICNIQLPDINVILMAPNEQNFQGCTKIVKRLQESDYIKSGNYRDLIILPILSRLDRSHVDFNYWVNEFCKRFHHLLPALDKEIDPLFLEDIFADIYLQETFLQYVQKISAGENLFFSGSTKSKSIAQISFEQQYINISEYIKKISDDNSIDIYEQIDNETWRTYMESAALQFGEKDNIKAAKAAHFAGETTLSIRYGGIPDAFLRQGHNNLLIGKLDTAIECYEKGVRKNSINLEIKDSLAFSLGCLYFEFGKYEKSENCFKEVSSVPQVKFWSLNNRGAIAFVKGDYDLAENNFKNALLLFPNNTNVLNNLATTLYEKSINKGEKIAESAIQLFAAIIQKEKKDKFLNPDLGRIYFEKKIVIFQEDIKLDLKNFLSEDVTSFNYFKKLRFTIKRDDTVEVEIHWSLSGVEQDYFVKIWQKLGSHFLLKRENSLANKCFEYADKVNDDTLQVSDIANKDSIPSYLKYDKESLERAISIGEANFEEDEETATRHLNFALEIGKKIDDEHDYSIKSLLGDTYYLLHDFNTALRYYKDALDVSNKTVDFETIKKIGDVLSLKNDLDTAIKYYEQYLAVNSEDAEVWNTIALLHDEQKDYAAAEKSYQNAVQIDSLNPVYLNNLGFVYFKTGLLDKSKKTINVAFKLAPIFSDVLINLGHVNVVEGKITEAIKFYKQAKNNYDNSKHFFDIINYDFRFFSKYLISKSDYRKIIKQV